MKRSTKRLLGGFVIGIGIAGAITFGAVAGAQTGTGGSEPPTGTDSQTTDPTVQVLPARVDAGYGGAAELLQQETGR